MFDSRIHIGTPAAQRSSKDGTVLPETLRRRFLIQAGGAAATLTLTNPAAFAANEVEPNRIADAADPRLQKGFQTQARFLLVHGAWQGAWAWDEVIQLMADKGALTYAFDLPGSGEDQTPMSAVTLEAYAQSIIAHARALPLGPLVLVGHSMGGAAITAAASAAPELFSKLVYLCAFLPRVGESVGSLAKEGYALGGGGPKAELVNGGQASRLLPDSIAPTFFNDCAPEAVANLLPRFRPQPVAPTQIPATWSDGFVKLPKTYIHCSRDLAVSSQLQLLMASRANVRDVKTLDSGHEPFISQPEKLTTLLLAATNS